MKKYRIVNKFRFTAAVTVLLLLIAVIFGSIAGAFDASGTNVREYVTVKVEYGDTLWNLARTYGPGNADVRLVIHEICDINNVSADTLQAGQYITIPVNL